MPPLKTKLAIATTVIIFLLVGLSVTTSGLLTAQKAVPSKGNISSVGVEVYRDSSATQICQSLDWGDLKPGDSANQTVYIMNIGNTTETLHLTASNWNPSYANSILNLTWDKENVSLSGDSVVTATLTLNVSQNTGNLNGFSFDVIIQGSA